MTGEHATFLATFMTKLWEGEFPATCKVLAAVPDAKRDYRPDDKSRSAWELVVHLATGDIWFLDCIIDGKFTYDADKAKQAEARFSSVKEVVAFYEREVPARLQRLRDLPADTLARSVDFFGMMQKPAVGFMGFANNHSIHHRGQLAAYLRAMGSKVPAIYGGSADEPMTAAASSAS